MIKNPAESYKSFRRAATILMDSLAERGIEKSYSDSLDILSSAFGTRDWNTMAALLKSENVVKADEPVIHAKVSTTSFEFKNNSNIREYYFSSRSFDDFIRLCSRAIPTYTSLKLLFENRKPVMAEVNGTFVKITDSDIYAFDYSMFLKELLPEFRSEIQCGENFCSFREIENSYGILRHMTVQIQGRVISGEWSVMATILPRTPAPLSALEVCHPGVFGSDFHSASRFHPAGGGLNIFCGKRNSGRKTLIASLVASLFTSDRQDLHYVSQRVIGDPSIEVASFSCSAERHWPEPRAADMLANLHEMSRCGKNIVFLGNIRRLNDIFTCAQAARECRMTINVMVDSEGVIPTIGSILAGVPENDLKQASSTLAAGLNVVVSQSLNKDMNGVMRPSREILLMDTTARLLMKTASRCDGLDRLYTTAKTYSV